MARAAGSNTKFASVNLNKSYGKPAATASATAGGSSSGSGSGNGSGGRLARAASAPSAHGGGMQVLSRPGGAVLAAAASKGGKVIVPRPVNLPSLRREHAGNDPSIALVGGSGSAGWTKAPPVQDEAPLAAAASSTSESTTGMTRLAPALSAGSTWGTSQTLASQTSSGSLSGEQWPAPTQAGASVTNQVPAGRPGVYTPPRARAMQTPSVTSGHVVAVEKAVVLRGEDFPTLQAALPPPPVSTHLKQKEQNLKQREKQQELKDQQQKLQLLSEQHVVLKPDEVLQSQLGGPQLQPAQPSSSQTTNEHIQKDAAEESLLLEQQRLTDSGLSGRSSSKSGNFSLGPASSGLHQRRQSNWTDDERDSTFRPQGGSHSEWNDRSDRETDQPANRVGENFGYGRSLPSREMSFTPGRDGHPGKVAEGRESRFGGDSSFGRESSTAGYGVENSFSRGSNAVREGGFREWGGGPNRESSFGGRGFGREGSRDAGSNKNGGDGRPNSRGWDGFDDRHGFGNRDQGPHREANSGREGGLNRDNFFGRDNRRVQSGDFDAGRGRLGGDRFQRSGVSGEFFSGRGFSGQELTAGRDRRLHDGYHFNVAHGRSSEEIHGLDNFRPSQGVGIDPPMMPMLSFRRKKEESKDNDFRDEEREAFEAELERVQKAQELDRQRKQEEKEHAVEMAQKDMEDRERQAREEEERQAKEEEAAKEAVARADREALEAAQKIEDERKAREDEKRHLQLEEDRRKENARRKLQELEERMAKREAESKQLEEARQNVDEKPVNVWQRGEDEERSQQEDVEREEEERIVASITGNAHDDDDRAPLRPSVALSYSQASQRILQPEAALPVKSSEAQPPSVDLTSRVPEFRGSTVSAEPERGAFSQWRREQPTDRVIGSAGQMYPPHVRNENADFQASISRDRVYNGRGYGDRGDGFHGGSPNIANFPPEGASGEFSRRPHFNDQRWGPEEPGFFNKQPNHNRGLMPDYEGGALDGSEDRDDRRWGRDRMDRWRSGREGPGQRPSPPQTPPYFHGSETTEPSSYGRLRHSLSRQPRVPPPPGRTGPVRPPPRLSSEQMFMPNSQVRVEKGNSIQPEIVVDRTSSFSSQEDNDELHFKDSRVKTTGANVQQEDVPQQHNKAWSSNQRGWQQFPTSSLPAPRSFAQMSQDPSHEDMKVDLFTPAQASSATMQNGDSPSSCLSQSEDDYEQKDSIPFEIVSEVDKQELHIQSDDKSVDQGDDMGPTDVDEDEDDEDDDEGYETYEGYEVEDDDKEDELDEVDDQVELLVQGLGAVEVALVEDKDQGYPLSDLNEQVIEVVGATIEDDDMLSDEVAEFVHSGQLQITEEVGNKLLLQEETEQTVLRTSVTGSIKDIDASDTPAAPLQQLQPPLSFIASSMPQSKDVPMSSSQLASVWLPDLHHPSEVPMTLQFGLLPGTSLLQGSVPAIQIGSIQTPLHVPPHGGLQQVSHSASMAPSIQFGQLAHPPSLLQSTTVVSQRTLAANVSTVVQAQSAESGSAAKVPLRGQQDAILKNAPVEDQPGKDLISLQPQSPWINQFVSVTEKSSVEVETKETRFTAGSPGQRPERRVRDRGMAREGPSSMSGSETYSRAKNPRRDSGNQRTAQETAAIQGSAPSNNFVDSVGGSEKYGIRGRGNRPGSVPGRGGRHTPQSAYDNTGVSTGMTAPYVNADSVALRPRSSRRNNFRRTDLKYRDSAEQLFDAPGVKSSRQTGTVSTDVLDTSVTAIDSRDGLRDTNSQLRERSSSGDVSRKYRAMSEGGAPSQGLSRGERTSAIDATRKNGGKFPGTADVSVESLLGKHASETSEAHVSTQPGAEREDEDDFIEVRSKRQMLSDRRAEREKEIKAKSNLKAKEQASRKQRGSTKSGSQVEGSSGQGSKASGSVEKRTSSANLDNVGNATRIPQPGNTPTVAVAVVAPAPGSSQTIPLAPIGTPSGGLPDLRANTLKSSRSSSATGASLVDSEVTPVAITSDSPSLLQEGTSGTPIAWGGTHSTRQVVSLTQIQLEEAMKPARYEAPVSQQGLEVRGSMVLDPGTTVASLAGKDKLSGSATGPIGSLLAGDKIQFGAVTSPPIGISNSHSHGSGLNVVGSPLGSHVDGLSDKSDLKKPSISSSELDVSSFSTKGKHIIGQEDIGGSTDGGIDAEAEAEAAASAVAVAAISSDESVCSSREPMSIRITNMNSFGGVSSTANHSGLGLGNSVMQNSMLVEDSMAAALPADLSVEPTSISIRGSPGQASSVLSTSGQSSFSGLEMSQILGFPYVSGKDMGALQGSNDQGVPSAGPSASGWQPQHSGADSFYGGPPPSGFPGQYINPGAGMPPHMLVYTNPFSTVGQFGQLGFMSPTYLPSGKQPDWKHTPVWSSGPGVAGMSTNDGLGGITGTQRGSGNMQRVAPGPAVVPLVQSPGPFDLNLSAPFQIPNVDSSSGWSHVPGGMHVPMNMGYLPQGRRGPSHPMDKDGGFSLGLGPGPGQPVNNGNFASMDAAAQFPDELGLGDTSSSVPSMASPYGPSSSLGRNPISNQAANMSASAQSNKLRGNRRSSRVARGGNLMSTGNGNNPGSVNLGMSVNSGGYHNANGTRVAPNHLQSQAPHHLYQAMGGMGQPHAHHTLNHSPDQRGPSQQHSPRVGPASNWSGPQGGFRKGGGNQGRPPINERGPSGEKIFAPPSKLKQVYVAKPSSSPRRSSSETVIFNGTEGGQAGGL